jgi:transposase
MTKSAKTATKERPVSGSMERSVDERSESTRSGMEPDTGRREAMSLDRNETLERPKRRVFTHEYKARILDEADALADVPGGIGKLLRREGIYSSSLAAWRRARANGSLETKRRGPKPQMNRQERRRLDQLERENERLRHRLKQAETIIEFQKKLQELLGNPMPAPPGSDEPTR